MLRILVASLIALAVLVALKDGRILADMGLVGACQTVPSPDGIAGSYESCSPGKLDGRPDLRRNSCISIGYVGDAELWRCPAPLGNARLSRS